jgi:hypothetical protein
MSRGCKSLPTVLALARWPRGVLIPVLERATLAVVDPRPSLALGRAISLALIREAHPGHVQQFLALPSSCGSSTQGCSGSTCLCRQTLMGNR